MGGVPRYSSSRAVGLDLYNGMITGGVSMSLTSKRVDPHHVPCVLVANSSGGCSRCFGCELLQGTRSQAGD